MKPVKSLEINPLADTFRFAGSLARNYAKGLGSLNALPLDSTSMALGTLDRYREAIANVQWHYCRHPRKLLPHTRRFWVRQARLTAKTGLGMLGIKTAPEIAPDKQESRFRDQDWSLPPFDYLKQSYLNWCDTVMAAVEDGCADMDEHEARLCLFFTRQYLSALSPANTIATNPELLRETFQSGGMNLLRGWHRLVADFEYSGAHALNVAMTEREAFEFGKDVAATPGKVVFQNRLMQLIQYAPATEHVYREPILLVPAYINKYYILDLCPGQSLIEWMVQQGFTVFCISWVNPGREHDQVAFADYVQQGVITAAETITAITGEKRLHAAGYCIGGTVLAAAASIEPHHFHTTSYLATLLDFSRPGDLGVFVDKTILERIATRIQNKGYLDGRDLALTFNLLRENELFWPYVIDNYGRGKQQAISPLFYWNTDSTNVPAATYNYYLREFYLHNKLVRPGSIPIGDQSVNLQENRIPSYCLATEKDHIAEWQGCYLSARALGGKTRFVLAGSGHIAGVINPPSRVKYGFRHHHGTNSMPDNPDEWLASARDEAGSWWPDWHKWLKQHSAKTLVAGRVPGEGKPDTLENAPGTYASRRITDASTD